MSWKSWIEALVIRPLKPLFRPEVLRDRLRSFAAPQGLDEARRKLAVFASFLSVRHAQRLTEDNLKPSFLADVFGALLGYATPNQSPDAFTLVPEFPIPSSQERADAVLGRTPRDGKDVVVAVEIKGPLDPLDIPHGGRRLSAVEQGFDYAINLGCDWIVVTSMAETRLYYKGADRFTCERFETARIAANEDHLRRFIFLLGAERVVPSHDRSHLYELLEDSKAAGRNITKAYYEEYSHLRTEAFILLSRDNPAIEKTRVLSAAQKLLDRVLFCAFGEDRGLLPAQALRDAFEHADPYNPRPKWENFRGLFRSINEGSPPLKIPRYNGGLFAPDEFLDALVVPDEVCAIFKQLAEFDYRALESDDAIQSLSAAPAVAPAFQPATPLESSAPARPLSAGPKKGAKEATGRASQAIDVEILGHIFEQSITDLERLRLELEGKVAAPDPKQAKARRKKEGAFYTPKFITRYIVEQTLGPVLRERQEALRARRHAAAPSAARAMLADPLAADPESLKPAQRNALIAFWTDWQAELARIRVLDPACGSGAFLIEAFDQLLGAYQDANARLEALRGQPEMFDLNRQILHQNLYGVDLNDEAIEICRLSLWIKTAERGKVLTDLDHTIRVGNSVIDDPAVHPRAFPWREAFPEVFADGAFDVVVGNPPYIRQELLGPYKEYLQRRYRSFHGMADIYVYFYELGAGLLRPGGRLSFVVTNKWMKAGYGEPLRRFFHDQTWVESIVDLGHAKQVFEEADVFPSILVIRRPDPALPVPATTRVCSIPREQLRIEDLGAQIKERGLGIEREALGAQAWQLQPRGVFDLMAKLEGNAVALKECLGESPRYGIKTGFNEAYLINTATRDALVAGDPKCGDIIKPYLRGQDIRRWSPAWNGLWMVVIPSSGDFGHPWANAGDEAESVFRNTNPGLYAHMKVFEPQLRKRQDQGRFWWELRACAY